MMLAIVLAAYGQAIEPMQYRGQNVTLREVREAITAHFGTFVSATADIDKHRVTLDFTAGSALEAVALVSKQAQIGLNVHHADPILFTPSASAVAGYTMAGPVLVAIHQPAPRHIYYQVPEDPTDLIIVASAQWERPDMSVSMTNHLCVRDAAGHVEELKTNSGGTGGRSTQNDYPFQPSLGSLTASLTGELTMTTYHTPYTVTIPYREGAHAESHGLTIRLADLVNDEKTARATLQVDFDSGATPVELALLATVKNNRHNASDEDRRYAGLLHMLLRQPHLRNAEIHSWWGYKIVNGASWQWTCEGNHLEAKLEMDLADQQGNPWVPAPNLSGATLKLTFCETRIAITPFELDNVPLNPPGDRPEPALSLAD